MKKCTESDAEFYLSVGHASQCNSRPTNIEVSLYFCTKSEITAS
jgi:hypothetical protein